jgi:hypothetical protein
VAAIEAFMASAERYPRPEEFAARQAVLAEGLSVID